MSSNQSNIKHNDDYRNIMNNYDIAKNITNSRITRYEKSEIMGARITQLANGAPPMIKIEPNEQLSIHDIVKREYDQGVIPYIIERRVGDDHIEYWKFRDLIRD
jgi:DNA-directed RNA polymerase subunit K/omega